MYLKCLQHNNILLVLLLIPLAYLSLFALFIIILFFKKEANRELFQCLERRELVQVFTLICSDFLLSRWCLLNGSKK